MSCSITLKDLTLLTKELMIREGIKDYDLHIKGHSAKGENYLGDVTFFSVVPKEERKEYNLVMKTAKRSEKLRSAMPVGSAYRRESFMYRMVFPEMTKFLKLAGDVVQLDYIPKIYSVCDEETRETLILENLSNLGYRVCDRSKPMSLEHVLMVLEYLGKHHAVSLALREKNPKVFKEMTKGLSNILKEFSESIDLNTFYEPLLQNACDLLKKSGREDLAKKVDENIKANIKSLILCETPDENRPVICHGDCWNNNIMFKYKDSGDLHPSGVCFVDFQLSMLHSPVMDLTYFLYTACDKSILDNFELLLQTYVASLSTTMRMLGCNSENFFTYEELMKQWKKYGAAGLILCTMIVKVELLSPEEAPDMREIAEAGGDASEMFHFKMGNEDTYNRRLLDIFIHFGDMFL